MFDVKCTSDLSKFYAKCDQLKQGMKVYVEKAAIEMTKIAANAAMEFTPPMSPKDSIGFKEGKIRQEERIRWNLFGGDKFKCPFTIVEDRESFVDAKGKVRNRKVRGSAGTDPRVILRQGRLMRRNKAIMIYPEKRGQRVTRSALNKELARRKKNVGRLAAGWMAGAMLSGRKSIPAFIRRHGGSGGWAYWEKEDVTAYIVFGNRGKHRNLSPSFMQLVIALTEERSKKKLEFMLKKLKNGRTNF